MDRSLTITAKAETIPHVASSVFAKVESVFAVMQVSWVTVWPNYLREGYGTAIHLEADAFRLGDFDGLEIIPQTYLSLHGFSVVGCWRRGV